MSTFTLRCGDALTLLRELPDESVQCCITSPPYWGLRDYGTAKWEGGSVECEHLVRSDPRVASSTLSGGKLTTGHQREGFKTDCPRCGATRIDVQLGLERTPEEYVGKLVDVFREVRRVLKNDGTLWLNLADSYAGGNGIGRNDAGRDFTGGGGNILGSGNPGRQGALKRDTGLKPKDLIGIPWRVAFALQADGWYLRSDIIWSKPNPMPESVTDRPTKAHEYLFLLAKSERYYYDAGAIAEAASDTRGCLRFKDSRAIAMGRSPSGNEKPDRYNTVPRPETRNKRSVWEIATQPYSEAHFATFPEALVEPCILAGSAEGDTVLDPFAGSGTTGVVALKYGRHFIGIDLSAEYLRMARRRLNHVHPLFCEEALHA